MKILFIGDVVGRTGRDALHKHIPGLKRSLEPDIIIANGDNAAHGRGITEVICKEFYELGIDCITSGDHVWDQREMLSYISRDHNIIRPANYVGGTPGIGSWSKTLPDGQTITVLHLQGRTFMNPIEDPFAAADSFLKKHKIGSDNHIFIDFHAEATSEKVALGHYLDGHVSAVIGTHTHIPTADHMILPGGTAYQTDAGMTADYNSVIGADKNNAIDRFVKQMPRTLPPAEEDATLCGTFIITDNNTGLAKDIKPIRIGGILINQTNIA